MLPSWAVTWIVPALWKEVASRWTRSSSRLPMQWQRWWGRSCGRGSDADGDGVECAWQTQGRIRWMGRSRRVFQRAHGSCFFCSLVMIRTVHTVPGWWPVQHLFCADQSQQTLFFPPLRATCFWVLLQGFKSGCLWRRIFKATLESRKIQFILHPSWPFKSS